MFDRHVFKFKNKIQEVFWLLHGTVRTTIYVLFVSC